jgi:hypothetical protein
MKNESSTTITDEDSSTGVSSDDDEDLDPDGVITYEYPLTG